MSKSAFTRVFQFIHQTLCEASLNKLAVDTGYLQRSSKLRPDILIHLLSFSEEQTDKPSLQDYCLWLKEHYGICVSKQALHQRLTHHTTARFIEAVFCLALSRLPMISSLSARQLPDIKRITVKDSTRFSLPDSCAMMFMGQGKSKGKRAQVSIQYEYDLISGQIITMLPSPATRNDQKDAKQTLDAIKPKDLVIRDLGYVSRAYMHEIDQKGAFYINRLGTGCKLYDENGEEIDFHQVAQSLEKSKTTYLEVEAFLCKNKPETKTRLIVSKTSEQVYQQRIRKLQQYNKHNGHQMRKETRVRYRLNILLTNLQKHKYTPAQVFDLYSLRWQIEIIFKSWKSHQRVHKYQSANPNRIYCQLLSKLLNLLIHENLYLLVNQCITKAIPDKRCSRIKFIKRARSHQRKLIQAVRSKKASEIKNWMMVFFDYNMNALAADIKRGTKGMNQILNECLA